MSHHDTVINILLTQNVLSFLMIPRFLCSKTSTDLQHAAFTQIQAGNQLLNMQFCCPLLGDTNTTTIILVFAFCYCALGGVTTAAEKVPKV